MSCTFTHEQNDKGNESEGENVSGGRDGLVAVWRLLGLRRAETLPCRKDSGYRAPGIVFAVAVAALPRTRAEDKEPRWPQIVTAYTDGTLRA